MKVQVEISPSRQNVVEGILEKMSKVGGILKKMAKIQKGYWFDLVQQGNKIGFKNNLLTKKNYQRNLHVKIKNPGIPKPSCKNPERPANLYVIY